MLFVWLFVGWRKWKTALLSKDLYIYFYWLLLLIQPWSEDVLFCTHITLLKTISCYFYTRNSSSENEIQSLSFPSVLMKTQVLFQSPWNISGASQWNWCNPGLHSRTNNHKLLRWLNVIKSRTVQVLVSQMRTDALYQTPSVVLGQVNTNKW